MTDPATEAAFQSALDAHPDDHFTRLVFADYLDECGDPRAEGYRVLAAFRCEPQHYTAEGSADRLEAYCFWNGSGFNVPRRDAYLPDDWFALLADHRAHRPHNNYRNYNTRAECEDAAARAFVLLSPARRAELLAQPAPA